MASSAPLSPLITNAVHSLVASVALARGAAAAIEQAHRVQHALTRADRGHEAVGVIFLDVDDFKTINDSLGYPVGDEVLREVGRRIAEVIRPTDTAARFGGDEFAVLVEGIPGAQAVADMAANIVAAFVAPVRLEAQDIVVCPSLGIAVAVPDPHLPAISADDLVRNADAAMYICKRDGEGGYRVFEERMHARVLERLTLRGELQRAIETDQFELYFQPIIDLQSGNACGVEALCRWNHPTRGFVQPDQFIPLAEETGLIVEIGRWVLQEGCRPRWSFRSPCRPTYRSGSDSTSRSVSCSIPTSWTTCAAPSPHRDSTRARSCSR